MDKYFFTTSDSYAQFNTGRRTDIMIGGNAVDDPDTQEIFQVINRDGNDITPLFTWTFNYNTKVLSVSSASFVGEARVLFTFATLNPDYVEPYPEPPPPPTPGSLEVQGAVIDVVGVTLDQNLTAPGWQRLNDVMSMSHRQILSPTAFAHVYNTAVRDSASVAPSEVQQASMAVFRNLGDGTAFVMGGLNRTNFSPITSVRAARATPASASIITTNSGIPFVGGQQGVRSNGDFVGVINDQAFRFTPGTGAFNAGAQTGGGDTNGIVEPAHYLVNTSFGEFFINIGGLFIGSTGNSLVTQGLTPGTTIVARRLIPSANAIGFTIDLAISVNLPVLSESIGIARGFQITSGTSNVHDLLLVSSQGRVYVVRLTFTAVNAFTITQFAEVAQAPQRRDNRARSLILEARDTTTNAVIPNSYIILSTFENGLMGIRLTLDSNNIFATARMEPYIGQLPQLRDQRRYISNNGVGSFNSLVGAWRNPSEPGIMYLMTDSEHDMAPFSVFRINEFEMSANLVKTFVKL